MTSEVGDSSNSAEGMSLEDSPLDSVEDHVTDVEGCWTATDAGDGLD